jgi:phosphoadenosine phosphosulfate reductase
MTLVAALDALPRGRTRSRGELEEVAREGAAHLHDRDAFIVVEWAAQTFGERLCVTSSMTDAVVAHLVSQVVPGVEVVFLDTGYHFPETIGTRDAVQVLLPVEVLSVRPALSVAEQDALYGPRLYERDPDLCCKLRKVEPLQRALTGYDAWVTGLRRDESPSRAGTPLVDWDEKRGMVKVNPIAAWTQRDVDNYVAFHDVLVNPLTQLGYTSVGCAPCTRAPGPGEDARAGRWAGRAKTECGIHS